MTNQFPAHLQRTRKARRLSQLELAARADTTQRHVSFVEQGRSRPGPGVVTRLADAMELSLRQRNDFLRAAGFAPPFPESPLDDEALRPVRRSLETATDITLAELELEAFLPADEATADILRKREERW